jgi:hypothetical protein
MSKIINNYMNFSVNFVKILLGLSLLLLLPSCFVKTDFNSSKINHSKNIEFIEGSEDIPLYNALVKVNEESLNFDTTAGSISSLSYESSVNLNKVHQFYLKTMPQMGWKVIQNSEKKIIFLREKQKLEIELYKQEEKKIVKFFISSAV